MSDYIDRYTPLLAVAGILEIAFIFASAFSETCRWLAVAGGGALALPIGLWYKHLFTDL